MSDYDNDFGTFLAGFIVGGMVGAAVALLMAPQSGEETRAIIKEKSIELKDKAVETAEEARVRGEKALEEARVRAEAAYADARQKAEELAQLTKERAAELQKKGQVVLEEQKTRLEEAADTVKKAVSRKKDELGDNNAATGEVPLE
jgi:gas vesicle protein